jgi:hypothetical protein
MKQPLQMVIKRIFLLLLLCGACLSTYLLSEAAEKKENAISEKLHLVHAVMCEEIKGHEPLNETIIFSISSGEATCFTFFNPVPDKTYIYHKWYKKDKLSSRVKLRVNPPSWSTFSRIQFREADKGPWRVEITDLKGNLFQTLRFSITD